MNEEDMLKELLTIKETLDMLSLNIDILIKKHTMTEVEETINNYEVFNFIDVFHVWKDGKIVETPKAYLIKPVKNTTKGAWLPKSMIETIKYPNSTRNDTARIIFQEKYKWKAKAMEYDVELR